MQVKESARFVLVGFPKISGYSNSFNIYISTWYFWMPSLVQEFKVHFKKVRMYVDLYSSKEDIPVILRNLLAPGVDPPKMFYKFYVGDLSSTGEDQVLACSDLLFARWQDSQMRIICGSSVVVAQTTWKNTMCTPCLMTLSIYSLI